MHSEVTLGSIFRTTKCDLATSLSGLVVPKDINEIQNRITVYLNNVCDEENDFRQNLTQSEDYILQAALSLLNAQCDMVSTLNQTPEIESKRLEEEEEEEEEDEESSVASTKSRLKSPSHSARPVSSLIGAGGGALIGKFVLGGWGAVFGAIAGTALVLYLSQQSQTDAKANDLKPIAKPTNESRIKDVPVNTDSLVAVVGKLCESIDNLISTFRAQIQRVINKYESQEKPTIEREYRTLLEGIQSLVGYKRGHNPSEEKYVGKLQERIEDLAELLDNYDLAAVDYTEGNSSWFDTIESNKATEIKLVAPAIVKNGNLVIKGKVFISKK